MLNTHLADLIEKMTRQAQVMVFDTGEEAIDRVEELHSKALEMTYPDLDEAGGRVCGPGRFSRSTRRSCKRGRQAPGRAGRPPPVAGVANGVKCVQIHAFLLERSP